MAVFCIQCLIFYSGSIALHLSLKIVLGMTKRHCVSGLHSLLYCSVVFCFSLIYCPVFLFFFCIGIVCCIVVCHVFFSCVSLSIVFIGACVFIHMFHIQPY
jgi:hypothetical protein